MSETGDLVDVCTGTGAGQNATREYYLNRPAIFGPDDRGGAMALTAALEMHALVTGASEETPCDTSWFSPSPS